ncbi:MAG TPA: Clp protease N-terminal domain-containing protein [Acidimicrobiales bacterium]
MFERFSEEARRTVVRALVEARMLGHDYVGTEHTLIALAAVGGTAPVLASEGVTLDRARVAVADVVTPDSASTAWDDGPYTARARHTFELGVREAFGLDHHYVTNGHLLLGLLRLGQGNGVRALESLGVDLAHLRSRVAAAIESQGPPAPPPERRTIGTGQRLTIQQPVVAAGEVDLRDDPRSTVPATHGHEGAAAVHGPAGPGAPISPAANGHAAGASNGHVPAAHGPGPAPAGGPAVTGNGTVPEVAHACSFCGTALAHGDRFIAGATARICGPCIEAGARLLGAVDALRHDFTLVFDGASRTATLSVGPAPDRG